MQYILVTGGAGFIGSNYVRYVLRTRADLTVVNLDDLTYAGTLENLKDLPHPSRHVFVKGNICNRNLVEELLRKYPIRVIVNFAAESHVDRSILGPAPFIQTNIVGTFSLLEAARKVWLSEHDWTPDDCRFHHVSTDEVFGSLDPMDSPFCEDTPYSPNSPYAASKAASDHLVRAYWNTYGLPVTISNCSNNYGPRQFPEKLIPLIILNAIEGQELPIYGDGCQVRDWLYVEDHCEAIWQVVTRGRPGETYNIGGQNQPTNIDIVRQICSILDNLAPGSRLNPHKDLIRFVADRPGHDRRYAMDCRKIKMELGWRANESLETGLLKTVTWYLNNHSWVGAVRQHDYQTWIECNYKERGGINL